MTPKLTPELQQALLQQPNHPLRVEDPDTHTQYVIVRVDVFEKLQALLPYDDSEPNPRDFYAAFREAVKDDIDAPGMDEYDVCDPQRLQP